MLHHGYIMAKSVYFSYELLHIADCVKSQHFSFHPWHETQYIMIKWPMTFHRWQVCAKDFVSPAEAILHDHITMEAFHLRWRSRINNVEYTPSVSHERAILLPNYKFNKEKFPRTYIYCTHLPLYIIYASIFLPTDSDSPMIHSIHCMLHFHYALYFFKRWFYALFVYVISFHPQGGRKKM